jgi:hypothetical protein
MKTTLNLDNVRSIPDALPRATDQPYTQQDSFNEGLVLTFETRIWRLLTDDRIDTADLTREHDVPRLNLRYGMEYVVRATLMRNKDAKILWRGVCGPGLSLQMDDGPVTSRLQPTDYSQLNEARNLLASKCSEQLLQKFFKRYEPHTSTFER